MNQFDWNKVMCKRCGHISNRHDMYNMKCTIDNCDCDWYEENQ